MKTLGKNLDILEKVGKSFEELTQAKQDSPIGEVFEQFGTKITKDLKQGIKDTSGQLSQSIRFEANVFAQKYTFTLSLEDYYKYLDKGVSGTEVKRDTPYSYSTKRPPISALKNWARTKGLNEYAVRESIFKKGVKPIKFYSNVVNKSAINELRKNLSKAMKKSVVIKLNV